MTSSARRACIQLYNACTARRALGATYGERWHMGQPGSGGHVTGAELRREHAHSLDDVATAVQRVIAPSAAAICRRLVGSPAEPKGEGAPPPGGQPEVLQGGRQAAGRGGRAAPDRLRGDRRRLLGHLIGCGGPGGRRGRRRWRPRWTGSSPRSRRTCSTRPRRASAGSGSRTRRGDSPGRRAAARPAAAAEAARARARRAGKPGGHVLPELAAAVPLPQRHAAPAALDVLSGVQQRRGGGGGGGGNRRRAAQAEGKIRRVDPTFASRYPAV